MVARILPVCALAGVLLSGAFPAGAQPAPPEASQAAKARSAQFQARVDEVARSLDKDPRLKDLNPQQRKDLIEFVTGNMLFALLHELGHASVQETEGYLHRSKASHSMAVHNLDAYTR